MFQFNLLITICVVHINNSLIFMLLCRFIIIIIIFFTVYNPIIDCKLSHIVWQYAQFKMCSNTFLLFFVFFQCSNSGKLMFKAFSQLRLKTCLFKETDYQKQTCKKLFGCLPRKYYFVFFFFFTSKYHISLIVLLTTSNFWVKMLLHFFQCTLRNIHWSEKCDNQPRGASHVVRLSSDDR